MIVERLTVEQFRGFQSRTSIDIKAQWTIIVGENGVGKTSVLWALRVLLSHFLSKFTRSKAKALRFTSDDITRRWPYLRAEATVWMPGDRDSRARCTAQKNASSFIKSEEIDGRPREHAVDTPDKYEVEIEQLTSSSLATPTAPLAVYYSAHRSLAREVKTRRARAIGGVRAAYVEALDDRDLSLVEAAEFWRNESVLEETDGRPARANQAIERALPVFLGEFRNIRIEGSEKQRLVIDKWGTTLDLSQLSAGERGMLAVLIDLTRRLAIANPGLEDPAQSGQAVVLIDELDLHMHPRWQRTIVSKLAATFPKCQFIATTHSPQIISEVQPDSLLLLREEEGNIQPQRCGQAYGLDANYVLEHIMGTAPRAEPATDAIHAVEDALESGDIEKARSRLNLLRTLLHGDDPVVVGLEATINNLETLADATDSEEN
jgi:predicted ATP-binding protein involved in virulence